MHKKQDKLEKAKRSKTKFFGNTDDTIVRCGAGHRAPQGHRCARPRLVLVGAVAGSCAGACGRAAWTVVGMDGGSLPADAAPARACTRARAHQLTA